MGIDYDTISAINPRIILATTSTFGSEGPYATRVGFDTIGQAMSGAMYLSGDGEVPTRMNAPFVDFGTALLNTVGVLAALIERAKSGKGQKVETALLRTAINITNSHLIEQAMLSLNRIATLNRGFTAGPSDTFKCRDGWCDTRSVAEALAALEANRIPAGPVYSPQQALDDPHVKAAKFLHQMDFPGAGKPVPVLQEPVKLSRTPLTIRRRAPKLGEHTDQILIELGYDTTQIRKLRDDRVI